MTKLIKLRSRMMGNYQVRFWRAVEGATSSLTLLAGALLSQGIAAVSIPGIWNGCPKDSDGNPILLPKLDLVCHQYIERKQPKIS